MQYIVYDEDLDRAKTNVRKISDSVWQSSLQPNLDFLTQDKEPIPDRVRKVVAIPEVVSPHPEKPKTRIFKSKPIQLSLDLEL